MSKRLGGQNRKSGMNNLVENLGTFLGQVLVAAVSFSGL